MESSNIREVERSVDGVTLANTQHLYFNRNELRDE
jgi:hypothetical protein